MDLIYRCLKIDNLLIIIVLILFKTPNLKNGDYDVQCECFDDIATCIV